VVKTADVIPLPVLTASPAAAARPLPKLGLSQLERIAVTGVATGDIDRDRAYAEERATAYATGDADVRRRALARAASVADIQMQQIAARLSAAVELSDERSARVLDKALTSATHRYLAIMSALRTEFAPTRRIVAVARGAIAITAEEQS
jgi:hypothetical protein